MRPSDLLLRAVSTCQACGNTSSLGSFSHWLLASTIAVLSLLGLLFLQAPNTSMFAIAISLVGSAVAFCASFLLLFRPVPFTRHRAA